MADISDSSTNQSPTIMRSMLNSRSENYWIEKGEKNVLRLFHEMAKRVPAYQDFLKLHKIKSESILSIEDFKKIPLINKDNYLRKYPRAQLCWDGVFSQNQWTIASTSGSTGEPYYFPRNRMQDLQYALTAELYLLTNFQIDKKTTLYINTFPMGVWIGGVFTNDAIRMIADRGKYALSIISPGINKLEILKTIKNLGTEFEQILIGSYAPFLKDILDDGFEYGIRWNDYNLGFIFSAEGFSEGFRDYIINKTGTKDIYKSTLNHYGTVDLGTMSHETPLAILIRRLASNDRKIYENLFKDMIKIPTLTQYNPEMFYFEEENGSLICSSYSGYPLVRYDLKDHGGLIGYEEMFAKLKNQNIDLNLYINKYNLQDTVWKLPFVYVYERSDFSVSFYAFQIYPATISRALQKKYYEELITGKFTMTVIYDANGQQIFQVNIELKSKSKADEKLTLNLINDIRLQLLSESSEYRETTEKYGDKTLPSVILWPYEDPQYFKPGIKQKWVKK